MARVSLSFDNGPDADETPRVLDVLGAEGVAASFFVVGARLLEPAARSAAERARCEGHIVGNHSYHHDVPLGRQRDPVRAWQEVSRTQDALGELAAEEKWFRPFGGGGTLDDSLLSRAVLERLVAERYSCVLWNCVPRDWERPRAWVPVAREQVASLEHALVVIHDVIPGSHRQTEALIRGLRADGHEITAGFPPSCVPLLRGEAVGALDDYVARSPD